jgi:hypothetical protein
MNMSRILMLWIAIGMTGCGSAPEETPVLDEDEMKELSNMHAQHEAQPGGQPPAK